MSSGIHISDEVKDFVDNMRLRRSGDCHADMVKFVKFKITEKEVIVDKDSILRVRDLENETDIYAKIKGMLEDDACCYALYDCKYLTKETPREDLVFIHWAPECASIKQKMVYACTKDAMNKKCLHGIKIICQMTDPSDKEPSSLVEKLEGTGSGSTVIELEGCPLSQMGQGHAKH